MPFTRYAIFYVPAADARWARFATSWLGWDMQAGQNVPHPQLPDLPAPLDEITRSPRKYGLHATLKPPFRLATGVDQADLQAACLNLGRNLAPVMVGPLKLTRMGRFLALCPPTSGALSTLAATCVRDLDPLRAGLSQEDLQRRDKASLTPRQRKNLMEWGYPFVLADFRFHITLTGRLPKADLGLVQTLLGRSLTPHLPQDSRLDNLALVAEGAQGRFHLIRRFELSG